MSERIHAEELERVGENVKVRVAGWVEDIRPLGKLAFITVRDSTGLIQVVLLKGKLTAEEFKKALSVSKQSLVAFEGVTQKSRSKKVPVEVVAEKFHVYAVAEHPLPIDPTGRISASLDKRLDARALELRRPKNIALFRIRHTILQSIRNTMSAEGFIEVTTPRIILQGAEGGATLFQLDYFGRVAYLAQSPQLYKEQLVLAFDRVFEIGPFFRAEKSKTRRHLAEFTSIDVEAALYSNEEMMRLAEKVVVEAIKSVIEKNARELRAINRSLEVPEVPFKVLTYSEAVKTLKSMGYEVDPRKDLSTEALRALGKVYKGFYSITDWPSHLRPFYIKDKGDGYTHSFDLMHGYLELASGGERVSDLKTLERKIIEANLRLEDFSDHLNVFKWGLPPHSGWGMGLERLMMAIVGVKNIREVTFYSRDVERLRP